MNVIRLLARGTEWAVYPLLLVLLFLPTVFFQVTTHETFKVSSETAIVTAAWAVIVAVAAARALNGRPLLGGGKGSWSRRLAIGLLGWVLLTTPFAYNPDSSWGYALTFVSYMLVAQSVLGWVEMKIERRRFVVGALIAALAWQGLWGLIHWLRLPVTDWGEKVPVFQFGDVPLLGGYWLHDYLMAMGAALKENSILGSLGNANYFAEFVVLTLPLLVAAGLTARRLWVKLTAGSGAIFCLFLLIAAGSRGALLGFLLAGVVAAALAYGRQALDPRRWWANRLGRVAMVGAAVLLVGLLAVAGGKMGQKFTGAREVGTSENSRLVNWQATVALWGDRPILGSGLGGYKLTNVEKLRQMHPEGLPANAAQTRFLQAHNESLQSLAELGLGGTALGLGALLLWFRETRRNPTLSAPLRMGMMWGVGSIGVASMFAFPLHIPPTALVLVLVLAMGLANEEAEAPDAMPALWRPVYAMAVVSATGLTGLVVLNHGVWPLFTSHRYEYVALKLTEKQDFASAQTVWQLADRYDRYWGSTRWNLLKTLFMQNKYLDVVAVYEASARAGVGMDSHYWYARALDKLGRRDEAREAYDNLLHYYPESHAMHRRAQRLIRAL